MHNLTNKQFKEQIGCWQALISQAKITLPNGSPLPNQFFHVFLGIGKSTFKKMVSGQDSMRDIQSYTSKTVHFLNRLESDVFLEEICLSIQEYSILYSKS
jgi:hypothetical protein